MTRSKATAAGPPNVHADRDAAIVKNFDAFEHALALNPDAHIDDAGLRRLASLLSDADPWMQFKALSCWRLMMGCSPALAKRRGLVLVEVDGAVAALGAMLRSEGLFNMMYASEVLSSYCKHDDELRRALVGSTPDLFGMVVSAMAALVPRAAAEEVGLPVGGGAGGGLQDPALAAIGHPRVLNNLAFLVMKLSGTMVDTHGSMEPPRDAVPALVAIMALPEIDVAQMAAIALGVLLDTCSLPALRAQCFRLGGRGLIRDLTRCCEEDLRHVRNGGGRGGSGGGGGSRRPSAPRTPQPPRISDRCINAPQTAAAVCDFAIAYVSRRIKRLLDRPAVAWEEDSGRLEALLSILQRIGGLGEISAGWVGSGLDAIRWFRRSRDKAKELSAEAGTLARPTPADAEAEAEAGPPVLVRRCAVCAATRSDGARLCRCRGCGRLTGVMYCGQACARVHWVKQGHRALCEKARQAMWDMEMEALWMWTR